MNENEPKKEQAVLPPAGTEESASATDYWQATAGRFRLASRIFLALTLLFAIAFLSVRYDAFTYEGFFGFNRDLGAMTALADENDRNIYYTYLSGETVQDAYRGGVVSAGVSGAEIYAANGSLLLRVDFQMKTPRLSVSDSYILFYDYGGTDFLICDAYTELYRGQCEYPILSGFMSDAGYFSLITASKETLSRVLVYDSNFMPVMSFGRASVTVSAVLSPNGKYVALLGVGSAGTVLDIFRVGGKEKETSLLLYGYPLAAGFTGNTTLAVLTESDAYSITLNGKIRHDESLQGRPMACRISPDGLLVALEKDRFSGEGEILFLNKRGKVKLKHEFSGTVRALRLSEDTLFVLGNEQITAIRKKDGAVRLVFDCGSEAQGLAPATGGVRVFYPAQALRILTDD